MEFRPIEIAGHHLINFYLVFLKQNWERRIDRLLKSTDVKKHGKEFVKNAGNIFEKIASDSQIKIKLVAITDDFCKGCLKFEECQSQKQSKEIDEAVIRAFGCEVNGIYSRQELLRKGGEFIKDYIEGGLSGSRMNKTVAWLSAGEQILNNLRYLD